MPTSTITLFSTVCCNFILPYDSFTSRAWTTVTDGWSFPLWRADFIPTSKDELKKSPLMSVSWYPHKYINTRSRSGMNHHSRITELWFWCFADSASQYNPSNWPIWCTKSCFIISLLNASTCFEHYVLIIRMSKWYYTASGIITPSSSGGQNCIIQHLVSSHAHHQEVKIVLYSIWYHDTLIIRRSKLYYTASGIITNVGGRPVHRMRKLIIKQDFVHQVG